MRKNDEKVTRSARLMSWFGAIFLFGFLFSSQLIYSQPGSSCTYSSGAPVTIVDNTTVTSDITVPPTAELVTDLNVYVDITHTWIGDVTVTLTSPAATSVVLIANVCGSADNMFVEFDDEAAGTVVCPVGGPAQFAIPANALSAFDGQPLQGLWTLSVNDNATGDAGTLNSWCLVTPPPPPTPGSACDFTSGAPVSIVDNTTVTSNIVVPASAQTITDLNVYVDISHTWIGDVTLTLTSPSATSVVLIANVCGSADNMDVEFDDEAAGAVVCPVGTTQFAIPANALSTFDSEPIAGTWTLSVNDNATGDSGTLNSWCLNATLFTPPPPAPGTACNYTSGSPVGIVDNSTVTSDITVSPTAELISDLNVYVDITHTWIGDVTVTLTSPAATSVVLIANVCGSADNMFVEFDDEAAGAAVCPVGGPAQYAIPANALSAFDGESIEGIWTLSVADNATGDTGTLNSWCMVATTFIPPPPAPGDDCAFTSVAPVGIVDNTTVTSDITVAPTAELITDMNIYVDIAHTWIGDVTLTLTSPSATSVVVIANVCGSADNMIVEFDDEAAGAIVCPVGTSQFAIPANVLSAFDGQPLEGVWTLSVNDNATGDNGTLNSWCLIPTTFIPACSFPTITDSSVDDCLAGTYELFIDIDSDGDSGDYDVYIVGEPGPDCGVNQGIGNAGFPDDLTCEAAVCGDDSFCCSNQWDGICATAASTTFAAQCAGCLGGVPGTDIFVGTFTGGTTGISIGTFAIGEVVPVRVEHNDDNACNQTLNLTNSQEVCGCTDPLAINFNGSATSDDGSCVYPPANDDCSGAESVANNSSTPFSTVTAVAGADITSCVFNDFTDVWYSYAVPAAGTLTVDTEGSGFDTGLSLWDACGGTELACDDDGGTGTLSLITYVTSGASTIYIRVSGFNGSVGSGLVNVTFVPFPVNNDCDDATAIAPVSPNVPYGLGLWAQANAVGTLWGATASGTGSCAVGTDVFYSLNVPFLNHYQITVNPFGGADVAWEVLDACGGTSSGCVDNSGAGIGESAVLLSLAAGDYIIRVSGAAASSSEGQFLLNVQAAPTSKVMDGTGCNESGLQLEDVIRCNLVASAVDYEWRFVEVGGGLDASFVRSSVSNAGSTTNRNLRLSWVPGIDYNKLYNVFVRAQFDIPGVGLVWGAYREYETDLTLLGASDCTVETGNSVTPTQLRPEYSPNNPLSGLPHTFCNNLVATWVGQAEQFEWELDGPTFHEVQTPSYFLNLGTVAGLQAGQIYQVRVRARVNGLWGAYGVQLPAAVGLPSNTQIIASQCGTTRALNQAVAATNTCGASSYTFRFQHATEAERVVVRPGYTCPLWLVLDPLTPGETYQVSVKVSQGGVDGDYSTACDITIAGPQAEGLADDMMVSKVTTEGGLGIYPNPNAGSEVRVELNGIEDGAHNVEVTIYDIYGKLMTRDVFGHQGSQLSRLVRFEQELATGMYLVHVTIDGNIFATEKLIVK